MRILIAGAGAIGSVLGGLLHKAGSDVTLLGRRAHLDAIASRGLRIGGIFGEHSISGIRVAHELNQLRDTYELILCCVKSYDTDAIAPLLAEHLAETGVVVSMQNGLGNIELLASRVGASRVLGARVIFGAEIHNAGTTHVTVIADPVAIGPSPAVAQDSTRALRERAIEIASMLAKAGVPTAACDDVMPILWTKVLYNAALNPLGALLELHYGALADDPDTRRIMDDVIEESFAVARAEQVALPFRDASGYRDAFYNKLIPPTYQHRPTMLYDLKRRGRTEIDSLNGAVVRLGERHSIPTPTNRMLLGLIRAAERAAGNRA